MPERSKAAQRIGQNIARAQGAATNIDVAHALRIHPSQISEWRSGSILPEITALLDLAAHFECSLDDLVRGVSAAYDAGAAKRRAVNLDHEEATLIAAWDTIRQSNATEAAGYLAILRARVENMLTPKTESNNKRKRK